MISIIDYKAGNLKSVERAVNKLGFSCKITQKKDEIINSERIIFPGVGAAGKATEDLRQLGLDQILLQAFKEEKPILGICLGAQIILDKSEENNAICLGLIRGNVIRFPSPLLSQEKKRLKIPHMGWNGVKLLKEHPVLKDLKEEDEFYFVHSYYTLPASEKHIIGTTNHGIDFSSIIAYKNLIATQFHPEKSGTAGLSILKNFCLWSGTDVE